MKFPQYVWNQYKDGAGKTSIEFFTEASKLGSGAAMVKKYNPKYCNSIGKDLLSSFIDDFYTYFTSRTPPSSIEEAEGEYVEFLHDGLIIDGDECLAQDEYKLILRLIAPLSIALFYWAPEYFIPYLFSQQIFKLNRIAEYFDIILPPVPKKTDLVGRYKYYVEVCKVLREFRISKKISQYELCAFLYDLAPNLIDDDKVDLPSPSDAWFIGGMITEADEKADVYFWQGNLETKRGDILIHYETYPISAITTLWRADTDAVKDPFFSYYSSIYLNKERISVPKITLEELKNDEYFCNHPLVRKNFQGVNGWHLVGEDYVRLLELLKQKGMDISILPQLYTPSLPIVGIRVEHDVEIKLLEYYLDKMGFVKDVDYITQLPIHAGRGSRIYPDYALHFDNTPGLEKAKVLIEVKLYMKSTKDIDEAFMQGRSYANLLESDIVILCDKYQLIIFERHNGFNRNKYKRIYWTELSNHDNFNRLKNIIK